MLCKSYHIPMIRTGSKTETRREWAENYNPPNVGSIVAVTTELFVSDEEADCYIRILDIYDQPLGEMTDEDAQAEGDYETVEEFREGYEDVYGEGSWDPEKVVTVVEFEYVGRERPEEGDDQTTLEEAATDGGPPLQDDRRGAVLSDDRTYRYRLWRTWDVAKPTVAFIMLNPSTADETEDDPTIRRCIGYAREWGYGELVVGNLYAVRETDPAKLGDYFDPIGPDNDEHLQQIAADAEMVVAAWGVNGSINDRGRHVAQMLDADLYALDTTKEGYPVHPLRQPADLEPEPFPDGDRDGE